MGTYWYVAVCRHGRFGGAMRFGVHRKRTGAGHIVAAARLHYSFLLKEHIVLFHWRCFAVFRRRRFSARENR